MKTHPEVYKYLRKLGSKGGKVSAEKRDMVELGKLGGITSGKNRRARLSEKAEKDTKKKKAS